MKLYYITFRSVTYAQRGERILGRNNIRCNLQRTPRWMEEQGCGYALRIWTEDIYPAAAMLRREKVQFGRIYGQQADGVLEVVEL